MVEEMIEPLFNHMLGKLPCETGSSLAFAPEPDKIYHDGRHILIVRSSGGERMLGWFWDSQKHIFNGYILKPGVIMMNTHMERLIIHPFDKIEIDLDLAGDAAVGEKPVRMPLDIAISNIYAGRPIYYSN